MCPDEIGFEIFARGKMKLPWQPSSQDCSLWWWAHSADTQHQHWVLPEAQTTLLIPVPPIFMKNENQLLLKTPSSIQSSTLITMCWILHTHLGFHLALSCNILWKRIAVDSKSLAYFCSLHTCSLAREEYDEHHFFNLQGTRQAKNVLRCLLIDTLNRAHTRSDRTNAEICLFIVDIDESWHPGQGVYEHNQSSTKQTLSTTLYLNKCLIIYLSQMWYHH